MPTILAYHRRREATEKAMAGDASSSGARIAHRKLALLHGKSADLASAVIAP